MLPVSHSCVSSPVFTDRVTKLTPSDLQTLQDSTVYLWTDSIPVKPRGGQVYLYTTTDTNKQDDWKADQYRWRNYGVKLYPAKNAICRKTNYKLQLRNTVSCEFTRISYEFLSEPYRVVIQYIGNSDIAVSFPHGNSKKDVPLPHIRTCPSVIQHLKQRTNLETPSNIYKTATGSCTSPTHHSVLTPRNSKQVRNAAYATSQAKRLTQDSLYNLVEISHDLGDFVHSLSVFPNLGVICGNKLIIEHCNTALLVNSEDQPTLLSYDTTFCLGDYYVSVLLFRMVIFSQNPVIPVLFYIHDSKTTSTHQDFFLTARRLMPNLSSTSTPLVTDQEGSITRAISDMLPNVTHLLGWCHVLQDVKRYVRQNNIDVPSYRDIMRKLLLSASEDEYTASLNEEKEAWPVAFRDYFLKNIDVLIRTKLGRWIIGRYRAFDPYSGITTNQSESFNCVMKRFMNWKEASVDAFVLALFRLHTYYTNEIERGLAGLGNYHLLPRYKVEAKDAADIKISNVVAPEAIVDSIRQTQSSIVPPRPVALAGELPAIVQSRALETVKMNRVTHVPNTNSFHVQGSSLPHVVTLFPKESCSCAAVSHCYHRTAVKMMLGLPHTAANISFNSALLLKRKRRGMGRKTGRKQPKRAELDPRQSIASEVEVCSMNSSAANGVRVAEVDLETRGAMCLSPIAEVEEVAKRQIEQTAVAPKRLRLSLSAKKLSRRCDTTDWQDAPAQPDHKSVTTQTLTCARRVNFLADVTSDLNVENATPACTSTPKTIGKCNRSAAQDKDNEEILKSLLMESEEISLNRQPLTESSTARQPISESVVSKGFWKNVTCVNNIISATTNQAGAATELFDNNNLSQLAHDAKSYISDDDEYDAMKTDIANTTNVQQLNRDQLRYLVLRNERYLWDIFQGKTKSERHRAYRQGGKDRNALMWTFPVGLFKYEQYEMILDAVMDILGKHQEKYFDYTLRVLMPEMLLKIVEDMYNLNNEQAENFILQAWDKQKSSNVSVNIEKDAINGRQTHACLSTVDNAPTEKQHVCKLVSNDKAVTSETEMLQDTNVETKRHASKSTPDVDSVPIAGQSADTAVEGIGGSVESITVTDDVIDECQSCPDPNFKVHGLTNIERMILESNMTRLNDRIINASQAVLKKQFPGFNGLEDTITVAAHHVSITGQPDEPFVQIIHDEPMQHWLVVTNVNCTRDEIRVYCSLHLTPSPGCLLDVTRFAKFQCNKIVLHVMNVARQGGAIDCGLYALAFAESILSGKDPINLVYSQRQMREHLLKCFASGSMSPFPITSCRTTRKPIVRSVTVELFCVCRSSNVPDEPMIQCERCNQWFHPKCVGITERALREYMESSKPYVCDTCRR